MADADKEKEDKLEEKKQRKEDRESREEGTKSPKVLKLSDRLKDLADGKKTDQFRDLIPYQEGESIETYLIRCQDTPKKASGYLLSIGAGANTKRNAVGILKKIQEKICLHFTWDSFGDDTRTHQTQLKAWVNRAIDTARGKRRFELNRVHALGGTYKDFDREIC